MRQMIWAILLTACGSCNAEARHPFSSSSVAMPADRVRMLPAPDYQIPIGTPHPFLLGLGSAHSGRWLIGCQARVDTDGKPGIEVTRGPDVFEGDALAPYLFRGGGEGEPIDGYVGASDDERWLVVIRADKLWLIDDLKGSERELPGADLSGVDPQGDHDLASFTHDGQVIYFRASGAARLVVVRDLATQHELVWSPPVRVLELDTMDISGWSRARLSPISGRLQPKDTSQRATRQRTCGGVSSDVGQPASYGWLQPATGVFETDPPVLGHAMGRALSRAADRSIRFGDEVIIPASCNAELVGVRIDPLRIFATCARHPDFSLIELFGPRFHQVLPNTMQNRGTRGDDAFVRTSQTFCAGGACGWLHDGKAEMFDGSIVHSGHGKVLLEREHRRRYIVRDLKTGAEQPFPLPDLIRGKHGEYVNQDVTAYGTTLVDFDRGIVVGETPPGRLAIDNLGRSLIGTTPPTNPVWSVVLGPVHWESPQMFAR